MKQNDIFRLALQAGFKEGDLSLFPSLLTKFADLVAAKVGIAQWHRGYAEGQSVEREACAKVCSDRAMRCESEAQRAIENGEHDEVSAIRSTAWQISVCAAAIRARSNQ